MKKPRVLSNKPQGISKIAWYYENEKTIQVVYELRHDNGQYIRTDFIDIPWSKLEKSFQRYKRNQKEKNEKA